MDVDTKRSGSLIHAGSFVKATTDYTVTGWTATPAGGVYAGRRLNYAATSGTTHTIPVLTATTAGNFLILGLRYSSVTSGVTISSVTDSKSNTWTVDKTSSNTDYVHCAIASARLTTALTTSDTIVVAFSADSGAYVAAYEFSGITVSSPADKNAQGNGHTVTSVTAGATATTSQAVEMAVSVVATNQDLTSVSTPTGYTLRESSMAEQGMELATKALTSTGTETTTWSGTSGNWACVLQTYKGAAAPGSYYATLTEEPTSVTYNGNALAHAATSAPGSNEWYWAAEVLYVNVGADPTSGTVVATRSAITPKRLATLFDGAAKSNFASSNSLNLSNTTEVSDPLGSGDTVFRMVTTDADIVLPNKNPETNLGTNFIFEPGGEYWIGSRFLIPSGFPTSGLSVYWQQMMEVYGPSWHGPPNLSLSVTAWDDPYIQFIKWGRNSLYNYDIPWCTPMVYDEWVNYLIHFKFASNGWVSLYINGQKINFFDPDGPVYYNPDGHARTTRLTTQVLQAGVNDGGDNLLLIQNYHKVGFGTTTIYHGRTRVGNTRHSVGG